MCSVPTSFRKTRAQQRSCRGMRTGNQNPAPPRPSAFTLELEPGISIVRVRPRQQGNSSEAGPWRGGGGRRYILGFNFSRRHRQEYWHSASSGVPGRPRAYAFWKSPGITPVRPPHRRARLPHQVPRGLKQGDGPQGTRRVRAPASTHSPSCAALLETSVVSIFWTRGLWVEASGRSSHTTIKAVAWHHLPDTTVPATRLHLPARILPTSPPRSTLCCVTHGLLDSSP